MLKTKAGEDKVNTLLSTSQIPIIDLAHCGKFKGVAILEKTATQKAKFKDYPLLHAHFYRKHGRRLNLYNTLLLVCGTGMYVALKWEAVVACELSFVMWSRAAQP